MESAKESIRTYCPMSKSRCGVIATVEAGKCVRLEPAPVTPIAASASKANRRRQWFTIRCA